MTRKITKKQAEALWSKAESSLLTLEDDIRNIIAQKAWEPLGYGSFVEAWSDRMKSIKLQGAILPVVIQEMMEEGASDVEIMKAIKTSSKTIKVVREAISGTAPGKPVHRRSTTAELPTPASTFHIKLDRDDYLAAKAFCEARGTTVEAEVADFIKKFLMPAPALKAA